MDEVPLSRLKQAISHIKSDINDTATLYELDSNAGIEALYTHLIADLSMALAKWRLATFERSEKRRKTIEAGGQ